MLNHDIRILYIFKSLYESGSASQVAKMHSLSPSKISRYLTQLRNIYMDTLFIRKKNHFNPTLKAQLLYPIICEAIVAIDKIELHSNASEKMADCVVALPATLSVGLPEHLNNFIYSQDLKLNISVTSSNKEVCKKVMNGSVDVAITNKNCLSKCCINRTCNLDVKTIAHGEFLYVVAHRNSRIWENELSLINIANHPFVVTQVPGFNDSIDPFEVYCETNKLQLEVIMKGLNLASTIDILTSQANYPVSFIGPNSTVKFMSAIQSLRMEKLPKIEYEKLHEKVNRPIYMIISLANKKDKRISIMESEIGRFIAASVK